MYPTPVITGKALLVSHVAKCLVATNVPSKQETVDLSDPNAPLSQLSGNILLADDEDIILITVKLMLEQFGFTVHTATNGLEAVEMVSEQQIVFCAAILDLSMPVMGGIEALDKIKTINPRLPVVLTSGHSTDDLPPSSQEPDAFLVKPIERNEAREILELLVVGLKS